MWDKDTYQLKKLEENDFPFVKELLWKVFRKKISVTKLKHKYDATYPGLEQVSTIAYHGKTPIAFYGAILQQFKKNNETIILAQACDSSTLEKYQGKGLHFELAKLSYELMSKQNVSCVYAFMNENSYRSTKKLGWKEHNHMLRFHFETPTFPAAKALNKLNYNDLYGLFFKKEASNQALKALNPKHNDTFQQVFTKTFVSYKNSFKNHYYIEEENCVFWVKIEGVMHVGLSYAPSNVALQKALIKIKRKAVFLGISEILFQVDSKASLARQLATITAPKKSWYVGYLPFKRPMDLKDFIFTYSDLDTF
ncbi:GNAT family N-acetyltransferase [Lacinutrix neustonica]|uniref:GNAT family N-acetyltransferase n=1 Tax=Lacinutrix neustonica TaxID=2980107 RepID=A0A9E8MZC7_9FLAO|nr:GNAT family N-acetyltransferase [Lacinutrix neustonica]WAC03781.1 GNAT family N-acetyltransferase [Lacinutrix neustonica]